MINEGFVAVGGRELDDLSHRPTLEELRVDLGQRFPDRNERAIGIFVGYWRVFLYDMAIGDVLALSLTGGRVAVGRVIGDYEYRVDQSDHVGHVRRVDWLISDLLRDRFDDDIRATLNSRGTICRIRAHDAVRRLETAAIIGSDPGPG